MHGLLHIHSFKFATAVNFDKKDILGVCKNFPVITSQWHYVGGESYGEIWFTPWYS